MKLSEEVINICKKHSTGFKSCQNCPIEKECYEYRSGSIRLYENFKESLKRIVENEIFNSNNKQ